MTAKFDLFIIELFQAFLDTFRATRLEFWSEIAWVWVKAWGKVPTAEVESSQSGIYPT